MTQRRPVFGNLVADEVLFTDTATTQSVTASAIAQTALAANSTRKGASLYNDTDKACYIKFGTGVTASSFHYKLSPKDANNIGGRLDLGGWRVWSGVIEVIWDAAPTGALRIGEFS